MNNNKKCFLNISGIKLKKKYIKNKKINFYLTEEY